MRSIARLPLNSTKAPRNWAMSAFDAGIGGGRSCVSLRKRQRRKGSIPASLETLQGSVDLSHLTLDQRSTPQPRRLAEELERTAAGDQFDFDRCRLPIRCAGSNPPLSSTRSQRARSRAKAPVFKPRNSIVHEQAFFYNRLKSERRREQERLKAAEDAKRAVAAKEAAEKPNGAG